MALSKIPGAKMADALRKQNEASHLKAIQKLAALGSDLQNPIAPKVAAQGTFAGSTSVGLNMERDSFVLYLPIMKTTTKVTNALLDSLLLRTYDRAMQGGHDSENALAILMLHLIHCGGLKMTQELVLKFKLSSIDIILCELSEDMADIIAGMLEQGESEVKRLKEKQHELRLKTASLEEKYEATKEGTGSGNVEKQVMDLEKELTLVDSCLHFFDVYSEAVTVGELNQPNIGWLQRLSLLTLADAKASKNQAMPIMTSICGRGQRQFVQLPPLPLQRARISRRCRPSTHTTITLWRCDQSTGWAEAPGHSAWLWSPDYRALTWKEAVRSETCWQATYHLLVWVPYW